MENAPKDKLATFRKIIQSCADIIMEYGEDIMVKDSIVHLSVSRMPDGSFHMNAHMNAYKRVPGEMDIVEPVTVFDDEKCTWRVSGGWIEKPKKGATE